MDPKALSTYFLLILIAAALILAFQIFLPFLAPLALAAAFAAVLQPFYQRLHSALSGHDGLAALSTLFVVALGILVPLTIILVILGWEAAKLYGSLIDGSFSANVSAFLRQIQSALPADLLGPDFSNALAGNLSAYTTEALTWISSHITVAFSSIAGIMLNLFIFFCALFFFLRDGESLKKTIIDLSPLRDRDDELVFSHLSLAVNSVIRGNLLIALIRGVFSAIGFFFFGIPNPMLWGAIAGIAGLIPAVGIVIVFAPAILYAFFTAGWPPAAGLLLWGLFVVGLIDNALAPRLVGKGMQMHPLFVLLSIFGGIEFFGPVGIFLGPLSLSLLFALLSIYATPGKIQMS
jgi:predicted PurR-regulated permease PerM